MGAQNSHTEEKNASESIQDDKNRIVTAKPVEEDDEPDEWDKRIFSTGCSVENAKMTDCYYEKKDWRACAKEMEEFKECWKRHGNEERTASRDA